MVRIKVKSSIIYQEKINRHCSFYRTWVKIKFCTKNGQLKPFIFNNLFPTLNLDVIVIIISWKLTKVGRFSKIGLESDFNKKVQLPRTFKRITKDHYLKTNFFY